MAAVRKTIFSYRKSLVGGVAAGILSALVAACSDEPLFTSLEPTPTPPRSVSVPVNRTPASGATAVPGQPTPLPIGELSVQASVETEPVSTSGDAADDMAIWYNAANPAESRIIGTDKEGGGLLVYAMDGRLLQSIAGDYNNVDLRTGFRLENETVALVVTSDRRARAAAAFKMNAQGQLSPLTATGNGSTTEIYGACMYRSPDNRYFVFLTEDDDGLVQQFEITANGADSVAMNRVRTFDVGSQSEGCVADDVLQALYIAEETRGIWRYGANAADGEIRTQVDTTRTGGNVDEDVEGLAIYYSGNETGYLIASSQGDDRFAVYDRQSNAYLGSFRIVDGAVDGVSGTDGIDVTNVSVGGFTQGVFVVQDGNNRDGAVRQNQNFKLVPWPSIANLFQPPLSINTSRVP